MSKKEVRDHTQLVLSVNCGVVGAGKRRASGSVRPCVKASETLENIEVHTQHSLLASTWAHTNLKTTG